MPTCPRLPQAPRPLAGRIARAPGFAGRRLVRIAYAAALILAFREPARALAQSILIDNFSTDQGALTLTYPPAGVAGSSSVSGAGILGSERDLRLFLFAGVIAGNTDSAGVSNDSFSYSQDATISGQATLQWDGTDGSSTLNPNGLGGIDISAEGKQDAFLIQVVSLDDAVNVNSAVVDLTIEVFSAAGSSSRREFSFGGPITSPIDLVMPYSALQASAGAGADPTNVGAITLTVGSADRAPQLVLSLFRTTSVVTATETVALVNDVNGNGLADPGDSLRYTVMINNPITIGGAIPALAVHFYNDPPAHTSLTSGSVTTTLGTVTTGNSAGDTSVAVNVGDDFNNPVVTITFDVKIDNPLPAGVTQISSQGTLWTTHLFGLPTDEPSLRGTEDPTVEPVNAAPGVTANQTDALVVDTNRDGRTGPGDTLEYTVVISNAGSQDASGVLFTTGVDPNTDLLVGSVTTTAGTVTAGNNGGDTSVAVDLGTVPGAGGTVTIKFRARVHSPLPSNVTHVSVQGTVTGTNIPSTPTNDADTGAPNDPTATAIAQPSIAEVPTLDTWGLILLSLLLLGLGTWRSRRPKPTGA